MHTQSKPPLGSLDVPGNWIWDSSVVEHNGVLYRYALSASKKWSRDERHDHAELRLATLGARDATWQDKGIVIEAEQDAEWPNLVIWTSNAIVRLTEDGAFEFVLAITGRNIDDGYLQRIGIAKSMNGVKFTPPKMVLAPEGPNVAERGYDVTDLNPSKEVIMAWRDPYLFLDPNDERWHLFFAAKPLNPNPLGPVGTVGHAVASDSTLEVWELLQPLDLPQHYHQLEVPSVIYRGGEYFLFVSTQNNPLMKTNFDKEAAFRAYRADSITGKWKSIYEGSDLVHNHKIYAPTIFQREDGSFWAVAFYSEDTPWHIIGTPIVPLQWHDNSPRLQFVVE